MEESLKKAKVQRTDWLSSISSVVSEGYKVTLKEDARTHSTMCMIQDAEYNPDVSPTIYVVRGKTAESALLKAAWWLIQSDGTLPDPDAVDDNDPEDDDIFA